MPFVALGGLLVVVCVLGYAYGAARLGDRVRVLAVARSVAAGDAFTAADVRSVSAARDASVPLILASEMERVVGRTAVVPLLVGTLLTPAVVGDAAFPPAGRVAGSVAVKPGRYPQGLAMGARVLVFVSAGEGAQPAPAAGGVVDGRSSSGVSGRSIPAVVLGVDLAGDGQGATVVTLLLDEADASRLAAAGVDGVVLMQTAVRGG